MAKIGWMCVRVNAKGGATCDRHDKVQRVIPYQLHSCGMVMELCVECGHMFCPTCAISDRSWTETATRVLCGECLGERRVFNIYRPGEAWSGNQAPREGQMVRPFVVGPVADRHTEFGENDLLTPLWMMEGCPAGS